MILRKVITLKFLEVYLAVQLVCPPSTNLELAWIRWTRSPCKRTSLSVGAPKPQNLQPHIGVTGWTGTGAPFSLSEAFEEKESGTIYTSEEKISAAGWSPRCTPSVAVLLVRSGQIKQRNLFMKGSACFFARQWSFKFLSGCASRRCIYEEKIRRNSQKYNQTGALKGSFLFYKT